MKAEPRWRTLHVRPDAHEALTEAAARLSGAAGRRVTLSEALRIFLRAGESYGWEGLAGFVDQS